MSADDVIGILPVIMTSASVVLTVTRAAKTKAEKLRSLNMCEPMSIQRMFDGPTVEEMEAAQRDVLVAETHASIGRDWSYWLWIAGLTGAAGIVQLLRFLR